MATILIIAIIYVLYKFTVSLIKRDEFNLVDFTAHLCIGLVLGIVSLFLITKIVMDSREDIFVKKYLFIESLQDNNQIEGTLILASGSIHGEWKYTFYCRDANGDIKLQQVDTNNVTIKYTSNRPCIEYLFVKKPYHKLDKIFLVPEGERLIKTTLLINKGAIKRNYNLDAK